MKHKYISVYLASQWFLGYQTSPSGWSTHWNYILDLAVIPPLILRIDFGLIYHRLFDGCELCKPH